MSDERGGAPEPREHRLPLLIVGAVLIAAFVVLNSQLPEVDLEQALRDLAESLGDLVYVLVGLAAFLETGAFVGLVAPGETAVILGGAIAGQGDTSVVAMVGVVWFAAWAGDSVSFWIGRRLGREFILRHGPKLRITRERFASVEGYFRRHGGKTIIVGRFIGLVRALAPFTAGSSGMSYRMFAPFSVIGTGLWAATFTLIGYFASQSLDEASRVAGQGTLLFGIVVAIVVAIVLLSRHLREERNRARIVAAMERRRVLRPLLAVGRRVAPRLTPGPLGLELTAAFAALAVGLYVTIAYAVVLGGDPSQTPGDQFALDVAGDAEAGWLTSLAKVVTVLGSAEVTIPLTAIAAALLAARRHLVEAAVLVAAMTIAFVAVVELKEVIERPRPGGGLVSVEGWSYPSGHAAHAVLYPWLAIMLALRLRPGITGASAMVGAGIALAALVGLSRIYLKIHYLSDVSGGWALGAAAFAACVTVALVGSHLRQNAARAGPG